MSPVSQSQRSEATSPERARQQGQRTAKSGESDPSVLQTLFYLQKFAGNAAIAELIETTEKKREPPEAPPASIPASDQMPRGPGQPASPAPEAAAGAGAAAGAQPFVGAGSGLGLFGEIASVAIPTATAAASPVVGMIGSLFGGLVAPAPAAAEGKTAGEAAPADGKVAGDLSGSAAAAGAAAGSAAAAGSSVAGAAIAGAGVAGAAATAGATAAGKTADAKAAAGTATGGAPAGAGAATGGHAAGAAGAPAPKGAAGAATAAAGAAGAAVAGGALADGAAAGPEAAAGAAAPTPATDPNFQAVKAQVHTRAAESKAHPPAHAKVAESQAAAQGPANEIASGASAAQMGKMEAQQPGGFDKQAFMAAVRKAIDAAAPQSLAEADDFKESGKAAQVGASVSSMVGQNKDAASKDIKGTTEAAPDGSGVQAKPVTPMPAENPGGPPAPVAAAAAMPQPKSAEEVSLAKGPADVNASMQEADVTEQQLKDSNEPEFQDALAAKGEAEKHSAEAPQAFRKDEKAILDKSKGEATGSANKELAAMHGTKEKGLAAVAGGKAQAKTKDEARRAEVSTKIQAIYGKTKDDVTTILNGIDPQVDAMFKAGEEGARAGFESYVQVRMDAYKDDRYSGWTGGLKWAKDKLFGMPDEVNQFYVSGRELYLKRMEAVISNVADLIGRELIRAKQRISQGQLEIQQYVQTLPKDLQKVGQEAQQDIQGKFDELSQAVDSKQDDLVNALAQKYVAGRDAVDSRIKEMKEANKGLVDKAIDAVKGVIETIKKLKDMLLNVLAKAVSVIGSIIAHPIKFLGNLVDGLKLGLHNFMANIGEHLEKGLLGWLFGALGEAGLTLPEKFDLKGILSIIMQILGLTYSHIRGLAVGIVGEEMVAHLEKSLEFFQILIKEGPAGLWKWIEEKLSELKDTVMEKIKEFIQEKVIIAGIMWLLGLLNPVAAFIKACKAIYDIVKFFIERAEQVGELINAILDSVAAVVGGNLGEMAGKVENALAKAIPVAIGFLASLLGLGGISDKIRSIIHAIQEPIHNIISKVLGVVLKPFKWIGNKLKQGAAWAKKKVQQGVTFVKEKAKAGVAYVKGKVGGIFGNKKDDERTPEQRAADRDRGLAQATELLENPQMQPNDVKSRLPAMKAELGLSELKLVEESEESGEAKYHIEAAASPAKAGRTVTKAINLPSWRSIEIDMVEISSGHMRGGGRVSPIKTLFPKNWSADKVERAVREAYRYGERVGSQGEDRVKVHGTVDGITIEMWVNKATKEIETAYPLGNSFLAGPNLGMDEDD
ncbi:MAG TPA: EndoU domain-containing protein [Candidatus Dormibacteraeota bacterium]